MSSMCQYVYGFPSLFTECGNRNFGPDCKESCGKCLRGEPCHHINGTCMDGCDSGYFGILCTKGNLKSHYVR